MELLYSWTAHSISILPEPPVRLIFRLLPELTARLIRVVMTFMWPNCLIPAGLLASTFAGGSDYEIGSALALGGSYLVPGSVQTNISQTLTGSEVRKKVSGRKSDEKSSIGKQPAAESVIHNSSLKKNTGLTQLPVSNGYGYTIYVAGRTKSSDFPVTSGAYDQAVMAVMMDLFSGSALI